MQERTAISSYYQARKKFIRSILLFAQNTYLRKKGHVNIVKIEKKVIYNV